MSLKRVLVVGREIGEVVALAGGTLAKLADQSACLFIAVAPSEHEAISSVWHNHTGQRVADTFRAEWLGIVSAQSNTDGRALRDPVVDIIRTARPDVIVVSSPRPDEKLPLVQLVFNAAYCSTIPNYASPTGLEAASVRAAIVAMDSPRDRAWQADVYVDISDHWHVKVALLELCGSDQASKEQRDLAEVASRVRGLQVQVEFAEAFSIEQAWGRLRPYRLLP